MPQGAKPTIGRIVHYRLAGDLRAALVVGVYGVMDPWDMVDLAVFERPGVSLAGQPAPITAEIGVRMGTEPGQWSWPVLVA